MAHLQSTRRTFLGAVAALSGPFVLRAAPSFEYVSGPDSISVLETIRGRKRQVQCVASRNPSFIALDATRQRLFAVNEIAEVNGLPAGSVESYSVAPATGYLTLLSRRSLSLSAIMPRHLAIAPDGRRLVVAVYGGGAYNVIPVFPTGELGPVAQILKEIGCGPHPTLQSSAHPHSVVFHPSGEFVLGTDSGSDRINVFAFKDGRLTCLHRIPVVPGSGPSQLTITSSGDLVLVRHELQPLLSRYRFNPRTGELSLNS